GAVDHDAAHGFGDRRKEVSTAVPALDLLCAHQTQVRFVDQRSRLKRLAGLFVGQFLRSEEAQLIVNKRQELLCGGRIALLDGGENSGDLTHEVQHSRRRKKRLPPALSRYPPAWPKS